MNKTYQVVLAGVTAAFISTSVFAQQPRKVP